MIRAVSYAISATVYLLFSFFVIFNNLFAQSISFDCPAIANARTIYSTQSSKVIEIPLAFSTSCNESRLDLNKVRADVCWNRMAYPLTDYSPRTVLQSDVDGTISIEERSESNLSLNGSISGGYLASNLNGDASRKKSSSKKYSRIPQHDLVVSSGPIRRATGAFFEFRPSRTESLEGGRNLVVAFEVPVSWRAGILQITCRANGTRKRMGIFNDGINIERIFIVPVHLKGDDQAFRAATAMARSEQRLRTQWQRVKIGSHNERQAFLTSLAASGRQAYSDHWMHHLIQSGSDSALRQVERQLPDGIVAEANQFDRARNKLLAMSQ